MQPHNPIEHLVIIVKENHSFDNYFGTYPGVNGAKLPAAQDPPTGGDPRHDHKAWLERAVHAVKLQYSEKDIPSYFSLAKQFTLCDSYFTEVASQFHALSGNIVVAVLSQGLVFGLFHSYQGWRNVFVISVPGALYGALAAWRRNLRANIVVHAWGDVWEGWLKFVIWR